MSLILRNNGQDLEFNWLMQVWTAAALFMAASVEQNEDTIKGMTHLAHAIKENAIKESSEARAFIAEMEKLTGTMN